MCSIHGCNECVLFTYRYLANKHYSTKSPDVYTADRFRPLDGGTCHVGIFIQSIANLVVFRMCHPIACNMATRIFEFKKRSRVSEDNGLVFNSHNPDKSNLKFQ